MDLNTYLRIFRRRWLLIALTVLVGATAAVVATPKDSETTIDYSATHRLLLQPTRNETGDQVVNPTDQTVEAVVAFLTGSEVAQRAAAELQYTGNPTALSRQVKATTASGSVTIGVTATDPDPAWAVAVANSFATQLIAFMEERASEKLRATTADAQARMNQIQTEIRQLDVQLARAPGATVLTAQRAALAAEYERAFAQAQRATGAQALTNKTGVTTLEPATARKETGFTAPRTRVGRGLVAAALGLGLGLALALVVERVDRRIRTKEMAEEAFGLPVLAEVPPAGFGSRHDGVLTASRPSSVIAEAYRNLRTSLTLVQSPGGGSDDSAVHTILVSSANPGEGKTTTATNLAAAFAEAGQDVLVLDCDFRHPRVGKYLGVDDGPGLSDALMGGRNAPRLADVVVATDVPGVSAVTSGSPAPNPAELFARGHAVIQGATQLADVVILDTPPMLAINDASELLPLVDTVVLVCRSGRTTVEAASRTRELLARLGGPVAGVVMVGSTDAPSSRGYYYYNTGNPKDLPFWRRMGAARRSGPALSAPEGTRTAPKGQGKTGKRAQVKQDRRPRPPVDARRQQQAAPSHRAEPPPTPPRHDERPPGPASQQQAEPHQPPQPQRKQPPQPGPPAARVAPPPQAAPPPQTAPPPPSRPDEVFAPSGPELVALQPDPIALGDPDDHAIGVDAPEDVSPSAPPPR